MGESCAYLALGTKRPTTWYCVCPVGSLVSPLLVMVGDAQWESVVSEWTTGTGVVGAVAGFSHFKMTEE